MNMSIVSVIIFIIGIPCVLGFGYGTYGYSVFPSSAISNNIYRGYSSYGFPPTYSRYGYGHPTPGLWHHPYQGYGYYGHNTHGYYYYPAVNTFPIYGYYGNYGTGTGMHYAHYRNGYGHGYPSGYGQYGHVPQHHPASYGHGHAVPHGHQYYGGRRGSFMGNLGYMIKDLFPYLLILKVAG